MFEHERERLIEQLIEKGIKDQRLLSAMMKVERHEFIPDIMKLHAYKDVALPIGEQQTISQPYTVAFMTEKLNVKKGSKILEIGTGSGYQAAVLMEMGAKVYSIERNFKLHERTRKFFDEKGWRILTRCSDGTIGWSDYAPYDGIIVTAGSPSVPLNLLKQLAIGGTMVIPVGDRKSQTLKILTRTSETDFDEDEVPQFAFVPLIGRNGWKE